MFDFKGGERNFDAAFNTAINGIKHHFKLKEKVELHFFTIGESNYPF